MKRILSLLLHRVTVISLAILAQLLAIVLMVGRFSDYFQLLCPPLCQLGVLIFIATGHQKSAYKIAWIIPIILFPIFGGLFYLVLGNPRPSRRMRRKMLQLKIHGERSLVFSKPVLDKLVQLSEHAGNQARYIQNHALYPVYENTSSHFFPLGELAYESMLEELAKAERYIFLEYFIIEEGVM